MPSAPTPAPASLSRACGGLQSPLTSGDSTESMDSGFSWSWRWLHRVTLLTLGPPGDLSGGSRRAALSCRGPGSSRTNKCSDSEAAVCLWLLREASGACAACATVSHARTEL